MDEETPRRRVEVAVARACVGAGALALYLSTLSPGAGWLDQSELAAGAHTLGVVHPPGHPLYVLLAKAFCLLLPFGGVGFRVNLLSALLGAACALLVAETVRRIAEQARGSAVENAAFGAAAGLLFAATEACWVQSVRAEVYALNALLLLAGVLLALRFWENGSLRLCQAFAVVLGLALCNHHYLALFFAPAPFVILLGRPEWRRVLGSAAVPAAGIVFLSLLTYAYLPLRAAADPVVNWGDPTTVGRFFDVLTARTFQGSIAEGAREAGLLDNLGLALAMLMGQLGPALFLAALAGIALLTMRLRAVGLFVVVALAGNLLTKGLMRIDPDNPDDYGYFLLSVALLCAGAGLFPLLLLDRLARLPVHLRRGLAAVTAFAIVAGAGLVARDALPRADLSGDESAEALTDATLDRVPPGAVVLVNYYSVFFNYWYAQLAEGRRPDVTVVHATFDSKRYDGAPYVAALRRRHPFLDEVLDEFQATLRMPASSLERLARARPVYVEPLPEHVVAPEALGTAGMVRRLLGSERLSDQEAAASDRAFWAGVLRRLHLRADALHPEARKVLLWFHWLHAVLALRQGNPRTAEGILDRLETIDPRAELPDLRELAAGLRDLDAFAERARPEIAPFVRLRRAVMRAFLREIDYLRLLRS